MFSFRELKTRELHSWYTDLQIREQQIRNQMELIRAELRRRVRAAPLPENYKILG